MYYIIIHVCLLLRHKYKFTIFRKELFSGNYITTSKCSRAFDNHTASLASCLATYIHTGIQLPAQPVSSQAVDTNNCGLATDSLASSAFQYSNYVEQAHFVTSDLICHAFNATFAKFGNITLQCNLYIHVACTIINGLTKLIYYMLFLGNHNSR